MCKSSPTSKVGRRAENRGAGASCALAGTDQRPWLGPSCTPTLMAQFWKGLLLQAPGEEAGAPSR